MMTRLCLFQPGRQPAEHDEQGHQLHRRRVEEHRRRARPLLAGNRHLCPPRLTSPTERPGGIQRKALLY